MAALSDLGLGECCIRQFMLSHDLLKLQTGSKFRTRLPEALFPVEGEQLLQLILVGVSAVFADLEGFGVAD